MVPLQESFGIMVGVGRASRSAVYPQEAYTFARSSRWRNSACGGKEILNARWKSFNEVHYSTVPAFDPSTGARPQVGCGRSTYSNLCEAWPKPEKTCRFSRSLNEGFPNDFESRLVMVLPGVTKTPALKQMRGNKALDC